ncbi:hypothetical protein G9A89_011344 [Geosiphon pyriformis]|nr:hypothetical protein G9A89_011344 [Geosiphon pyriformis]
MDRNPAGVEFTSEFHDLEDFPSLLLVTLLTPVSEGDAEEVLNVEVVFDDEEAPLFKVSSSLTLSHPNIRKWYNWHFNQHIRHAFLRKKTTYTPTSRLV